MNLSGTLSEGVKLTPILRRNTIEMEKDIHNFTRKLRLTEYIFQMKTI